MLTMPNLADPALACDMAETHEMQEIVGLYGKTFHFWQVERGDTLPLGRPELMMSCTQDSQVSAVFRYPPLSRALSHSFRRVLGGTDSLTAFRY